MRHFDAFARVFLWAALVFLTACGGQPVPTAQVVPVVTVLTPVCDHLALTVPLTAGPYFKDGSPERASLLEDSVTGVKLVLSGSVLTADCQPVAHALLEFWQADANGNYDNTGYILRGHQFTDADGHYQLTTIIPGIYPGRTEHIHVKVQPANGPVLTTQLFFPDVSQNDGDHIFDPSLVLSLQDMPDGKTATFDFVVNAP